MNKSYGINQSPLYKISSHKKLAKILGLSDEKVLWNIVKRSNNNYYTSKVNERDIQVPLSQLRRVHKRIDLYLRRITQPSYLFSGIKRKSNIHNAKEHVGNVNVLKIDIKDYYQSVTRKQIERCFIKSFKCAKDIADTISRLCVYSDHLPTGSPVSLSLSFAVNRPIFDHIQQYSKKRNITFTCYVDDITFSGAVIPVSFSNYVVNLLKNKRQYKCHKIRRYKPETPKNITGVVVVGENVYVKNKQRKEINYLLSEKSLINIRENINDEKVALLYQRLIGHLFAAGQINQGYRNRGKNIVEERREYKKIALSNL